MNDKRARIELRVTQSEKKKIARLAESCGLSQSEYIRQRTLGYAPRTVQPDVFAKISEMEQNKDDFLKAVRKFMEMDSLTAPMLRELIDHIDVYEKEGGKKNYTQRIVI